MSGYRKRIKKVCRNFQSAQSDDVIIVDPIFFRHNHFYVQALKEAFQTGHVEWGKQFLDTPVIVEELNDLLQAVQKQWMEGSTTIDTRPCFVAFSVCPLLD